MVEQRDVSGLLVRWSDGDREAFEALVPMVYGELRRVAGAHLRHERVGHSLQPTDLVHEAYLRLAGLRSMCVEHRVHFLGIAAGIMRRVLVDHARRRDSRKRGGANIIRATDDVREIADDLPVDRRIDLMALDQALERLEREAPQPARVVELRYFGGLSIEETAACLDLSPATVKRHWVFARAWLLRALDSPASA